MHFSIEVPYKNGGLHFKLYTFHSNIYIIFFNI